MYLKSYIKMYDFIGLANHYAFNINNKTMEGCMIKKNCNRNLIDTDKCKAYSYQVKNTPVQDISGQWVYIIPVSGLTLTDDINNEIMIDRVTFITVKKLISVRKRFGIRKKISELRSNKAFDLFFNQLEPTVAIVRHGGKPSEITTKVTRLVVEALEILATSQLGYSKRRFNSFPSVLDARVSSMKHLCLNENNDSSLISKNLVGKTGNLVLNKGWKNWQKRFFFLDLIRIINKKLQVNNSWRINLYRVARLIGQSQSSNNIAYSFLLNMIAIEALLTKQYDKYREELPNRIEAFIGWVGYWAKSNYKDQINDLYTKRCQYVHDGNESNIEIKDLLFTDDIIFNMLVNIIYHINLFKKKEDIISFTEKVSAEHLLGIVGRKSKIRPKTLSFFNRMYTAEDYKKI